MCRPWKALCKQRRGSMWSYRSGMDICGDCAARSSKASPNIATSISAMLSVAAANGLHPVYRDAEVRVWCWTVEESKHFISHRQHHLHIAVIAWLDAVRKNLRSPACFALPATCRSPRLLVTRRTLRRGHCPKPRPEWSRTTNILIGEVLK